MNDLEFKTRQLQKVNTSIEALGCMVSIPLALIEMKLTLEEEIAFIDYKYQRAKNKVFDCTLTKE